MSDPGSFSGDLYDDDMGDVDGGNAQFDWHGGGRTHHSVFGDGGWFSWDDPFDENEYDDDMDVHDDGWS